jgi:hypothetical protein
VSAGDFRIVAAYRDVIQAETAAELLQAAGLEARVLDAYTTGVQPLYAYALGGVKVLVREGDLASARDLLGALLIHTEFYIPSARHARPTRWGPRCPACGSLATVPAPGAARVGWVALWGFGLPLPLFGPRRRCRSCGHVWRLSRAERRGPEAPLPPAFARAIAEYEGGLRHRLVAAIRRVAAQKTREAERAAAEAEAARRRKVLEVRYEGVRKAAVAAVAANLASEAERDLLAAQAELSWTEIEDLERRPGALTGPARAVLDRLAAEARRRADLSE